MNRYNLLLATIAATFVAGCASTPIANPVESQDDKTHVTGSRLPARETSATVKTIDSKQGITDAMQRAGGTYIPPKGGAM